MISVIQKILESLIVKDQQNRPLLQYVKFNLCLFVYLIECPCAGERRAGVPWVKKYIDQEPPYLMRQICVLQWEEIKTKNSGAKHQLCGRGANEIYCYR